MNRFTVLTDIASRAMRSTVGSPKTVAGGVALDTSTLASTREELVNLPKWGSCTEDDAAFVIDFLNSQALAVSIVSINRETAAWDQFLEDSKVLHKAIILTSKKVAGWAKPPNLLKFILLGSACASATGHAINADRRPRIVSPEGLQLIDCAVVCDSEIEGDENLEVFKSFWGKQHIPKSRLASLGIAMLPTEVTVTTEQAEPALLLADYVAGLGLAATTVDPGRLPLPVHQSVAVRLLSKLRARDKLVMIEEDFTHSYHEIFEHVMAQARDLVEAKHHSP